MPDDYKENDYLWIKELLDYPAKLDKNLGSFTDTSQIKLPQDPIDCVIFQDRAKRAIRKIAQNRGHILMVGRPGTGKSMLANMFDEVLEKSIGDYLRPKEAILAFPGKDRNHIRFAYEKPARADKVLSDITAAIEVARSSMDEFNLTDQIQSARKVKIALICATCLGVAGGFFFPPAFIGAGMTGMGAIFMYMQENNQRAQEKIQRESNAGTQNDVKHLQDMIPQVIYDPRKKQGPDVESVRTQCQKHEGRFPA